MANSSLEAAKLPPKLLKRGGSFEWLRKDNDEGSRSDRRAVALETQEAARQGWYWHKGSRVMLPACENTISGTRIISRSGDWPSLKETPSFGSTMVSIAAESTALDAARPLVQRGRRVAIVNAASAHHVGGGFASGGRHALEEAFCVQSTLFQSLQRASQEAFRCTTRGCSRATWNGESGQACCRTCTRSSGSSHGPDCEKRCSLSVNKVAARAKQSYIPADGAVFSPNVEIFRAGTLDGYETLPEPLQLAVVASISMPNLNSGVRDAPVSKYESADRYIKAISQRWRAALRVACIVGATDIVCPDVGCGVYANDSTIVGRALAAILCSEYWGFIEHVWLVGNPTFSGAVMQTVGSERTKVVSSAQSSNVIPQTLQQPPGKQKTHAELAPAASEKNVIEIRDAPQKRALSSSTDSSQEAKRPRKWSAGQLRISNFFRQEKSL